MIVQTSPPQHRILVVEDEPAIRWTLALVFQHHGIETDVAESGKEAVRLLSREDCRYCCVLLDLNIPAPDGIELARFVREHCSDTPVVIISGYPDLAEKINNAELGDVVKLIVMKPVDTTFLARYVHGDHFCIRDSPPNAPPPSSSGQGT
jgi:DNA-binding response OmpR family regulator